MQFKLHGLYIHVHSHVCTHMYIRTYIQYSTDLVIDGVKLGEKYPINNMWLLCIRVVSQCPVELDKLVHCLVAHQGLSNKQD